jgi:precorrin-6B methylase 1
MGQKPVAQGSGNLLFKRMETLGFKDVTEFVNDTKVDLSFETCRRALREGRINIRHEYIVRIMQALDFTPQEIAAELKRRGDKHLHLLVQESLTGITLSSQERRIINKLRAASNPKLYDAVLMVINLDRQASKEEQTEAQQ